MIGNDLLDLTKLDIKYISCLVRKHLYFSSFIIHLFIYAYIYSNVFIYPFIHSFNKLVLPHYSVSITVLLC